MLRRISFVAVAAVALSWPLAKALAADEPKPVEDLAKVEVVAHVASLTETQNGPPCMTVRVGGGDLLVDCTHSAAAEQSLAKLAAVKRWAVNFTPPRVTITGRLERRPIPSVDEQGATKETPQWVLVADSLVLPSDAKK